MLIDLWSEETIQFVLERSKTSKETREVYSTLQVSSTFYLVQFRRKLSPVDLIDARDKFESQIFLFLFFHCTVIACIKFISMGNSMHPYLS